MKVEPVYIEHTQVRDIAHIFKFISMSEAQKMMDVLKCVCPRSWNKSLYIRYETSKEYSRVIITPSFPNDVGMGVFLLKYLHHSRTGGFSSMPEFHWFGDWIIFQHYKLFFSKRWHDEKYYYIGIDREIKKPIKLATLKMYLCKLIG